MSSFFASFSGSYVLVSSAGRGYPAARVFCGIVGCGVDTARVAPVAPVWAVGIGFEHPAERISAPSEVVTTNAFAFLMLVSPPDYARASGFAAPPVNAVIIRHLLNLTRLFESGLVTTGCRRKPKLKALGERGAQLIALEGAVLAVKTVLERRSYISAPVHIWRSIWGQRESVTGSSFRGGVRSLEPHRNLLAREYSWPGNTRCPKRHFRAG